MITLVLQGEKVEENMSAAPRKKIKLDFSKAKKPAPETIQEDADVEAPKKQKKSAVGSKRSRDEAAADEEERPEEESKFHEKAPKGKEKKKCFLCGQVGHATRMCTNDPVCFKCQQSGHTSRQCTNEPVCYKCKGTGHMGRECTK